MARTEMYGSRSHPPARLQRAEGQRTGRKPKNPFINEMLAAGLPERVISFDIETETVRHGRPDQGTLAIGGLIEYRRTGQLSYSRGDYEAYTVEQLDGLRQRLTEFDGLIVGYNVFDFDYRLLSQYFPVESVVGKTLDLLHVIWHWSTPAHRTSLDLVAKYNLSQRKTHTHKSIPQLWRHGHKRQVLNRNRRDCELAFELWLHLVRHAEVAIPKGSNTRWFLSRVGLTQLSDPHYALWLGGQMAQVTGDEWRSNLEKFNNPFGDYRYGRWPLIDFMTEADKSDESIHIIACCRNCRLSHVLRYKYRAQAWWPPPKASCTVCEKQLEATGEGLLNAGPYISTIHDPSYRPDQVPEISLDEFMDDEAAQDVLRKSTDRLSNPFFSTWYAEGYGRKLLASLSADSKKSSRRRQTK